MKAQVEYHCPEFGCNFVCYHDPAETRTNCQWCGSPVQKTGIVTIAEGFEIVTYRDGVEIERYKRPSSWSWVP